MGMNTPCPGLFHGISWSTEKVYDQTLAAAEMSGLSVHALRPLRDIDTEDDLRRWQENHALADSGHADPMKYALVNSENDT